MGPGEGKNISGEAATGVASWGIGCLGVADCREGQVRQKQQAAFRMASMRELGTTRLSKWGVGHLETWLLNKFLLLSMVPKDTVASLHQHQQVLHTMCLPS